MGCAPPITRIDAEAMDPGLGFEPGKELEERAEALADDLDHIVIKGPGWKDKHGFDLVSYDPKTNILHLWECKDQPSRPVTLSDLETFQTAWNGTQEQKEKIFGSSISSGILNQFPPNSPLRDQMQEFIESGRLQYHLVVGPDTKISSNVEQELVDHSVGYHL